LLPPVFPKIERGPLTRNYGRFIISPLERGYGITIGNALRRVLLSSLPGAAVTSLRVSGVYHEFSDIPHVKEDMTQLILNVKRLRLRLLSGDSASLRVEVRREGEVTAADLECPSSVEIVNPDLHLLTADSDEVDLELELMVQRGRGYSPAEERGKLPIGEIPVDAIFTPVRRVNFVVEKTRVAHRVNLDRLILDIWTDGTIRPEEALVQSAEILARHFSLLAGLEELPPVEVVEEAEEEKIPSEFYEMPIEDLGLGIRSYNCLKRAGITKVGEILERLQKGEEELLSIRNFGAKSLAELLGKLRAKGIIPLEEAEEEEPEEVPA